MRYYGRGDRIYMFGFSRGAFTARFLARMIAHVGLLSMGNEEMVPFAYKVYQNYETGVDGAGAYMETFRSYFCRHEKMPQPEAFKTESHSEPENRITEPDMVDTGIKVHFLGLFDTVNSVGTFDVPFTKVPKVPDVLGTAEHVRHAVAIDERRVKFKAALLAQDVTNEKSPAEGQPNGVSPTTIPENRLPPKEVIKEVWFPGRLIFQFPFQVFHFLRHNSWWLIYTGNHGDVGGGWFPKKEEPKPPLTWREWIKWVVRKPEAKDASDADPNKTAHLDKTKDQFQLSDIALKWMIDELDNLDPKVDHVLWNEDKKQSFLERFAAKRTDAINGFMHDTMVLGRGSTFWMTMMWKLMGMFARCLCLASVPSFSCIDLNSQKLSHT